MYLWGYYTVKYEVEARDKDVPEDPEEALEVTYVMIPSKS